MQWPRQLRLRLAWFLGTMVLVGLSGCGPGIPDHASNVESRASLGMSSESKPVSQNTLATGPVPFAAAFALNNAPASAVQEEPAPLPEYLALPTWIAQALDAPEVSVRLGALDTWAQQGAQAPLNPLIVALDDENDAVREKAMTIIEQNWVIDQDAEPRQ
ncbi:MAG: hypothetical protein ACREJN_00890 [Nitrospiraceae bacterium]